MAKWNKTYNLTAIREPARMVTHHLLDALAVVPHLPATPGVRILDVGSGGGVPGIPLAIARPDAHVVMIDSNHKKAAFLMQAAIEVGLRNVESHAVRVEDFAPALPFDIVISRAFSDLTAFALVAARHLAPQGRMFAMKGVHPDEELAQLPHEFAVIAKPALVVPGLDAARHLVIMQLKQATEGRHE
jgi:16S rRNA (guanine527-N7)-methyltransferase